MKAIRAHVENGRIIVDDPTDLPEGTVLQLVAVTSTDMSAEERAEFLAALDESIEDEEAGRMDDAVAFADRLLGRP